MNPRDLSYLPFTSGMRHHATLPPPSALDSVLRLGKPRSEMRTGSRRLSSEPENSALGLTPLLTSSDWQL
ncbi:hypothetical protein U5801_27720, partial [Lamprobacter modestohalophilus]|uniref:hypothetical protein n=1 Tax=Lamprobacter modestohalophilus TaxID=1064514 RepID=UPI002ADED0C1